MLRTAFSYQVHQCPKSSRAVEAIYLSSVYSFIKCRKYVRLWTLGFLCDQSICSHADTSGNCSFCMTASRPFDLQWFLWHFSSYLYIYSEILFLLYGGVIYFDIKAKNKDAIANILIIYLSFSSDQQAPWRSLGNAVESLIQTLLPPCKSLTTLKTILYAYTLL